AGDDLDGEASERRAGRGHAEHVAAGDLRQQPDGAGLPEQHVAAGRDARRHRGHRAAVAAEGHLRAAVAQRLQRLRDAVRRIGGHELEVDGLAVHAAAPTAGACPASRTMANAAMPAIVTRVQALRPTLSTVPAGTTAPAMPTDSVTAVAAYPTGRSANASRHAPSTNGVRSSRRTAV